MVTKTKISEALFEYDGVARVEAGPALITATATEELLADDTTAPHYKVGARDALGNTIELGQPMAYLDWLANRIWYVYALEDGRWVQKETSTAFAEADTKARALAAAAGA